MEASTLLVCYQGAVCFGECGTVAETGNKTPNPVSAYSFQSHIDGQLNIVSRERLFFA